MPQSTFNNLSDERKKHIAETAFLEFAINSYQSASVSKIVVDLGIAKGSFYRYFESKLDLYSFLCEEATYVRLLYTEKLLRKQGKNFWKWYKQLCVESLMFDLHHPRYSAFLANMRNERYVEELENQALKNIHKTQQFFEEILQQAIEKGSIPTQTSVNNTAKLLTYIEYHLTDSFCIEHNINYLDYIKENKAVESVGLAEVETFVDGLLVPLKTEKDKLKAKKKKK